MAATVVTGASVLFALPTASLGQDARSEPLKSTTDALKQTTDQLQGTLKKTTDGVNGTVHGTTDRLDRSLRKTTTGVTATSQSLAERLREQAAARKRAQHRVTATDPQTQPPLRGTNPHGQGSIAVGDLNPSAQRPFPASQDGKASGEEIIAGRARGEQNGTAMHGHITTLALFGTEVLPDLLSRDTNPGETKNGPLQPLQDGLNSLCTSSMQQVCLSVLTIDSSTTATSSTNDFAVARVKLGGLSVGAAESKGNISQDANCQTSTGSGHTANVTTTSGVIANVANADSSSTKCKGQAEQNTRTSQVVGLGGTGLGVPAAGCADGTPDTTFKPLAPIATIVCNADEESGSGTRQALDVFALSAGGTSLLQESTGQAESKAVAPGESGGPACSDGIDNDGDGVIDGADGGCHSDGNPGNPNSYNPNDTDEANPAAKPAANTNNNGNGNGNGSGNNDNNDNGNGNGNNGNGNKAQCADGRDNDGDGVIDRRDPGCHSDGNANNPDSYVPSDDSEANGGGNGNGAANNANRGSLAFTGTDVLGTAISGLLLLAGGLVLRRREQRDPNGLHG